MRKAAVVVVVLALVAIAGFAVDVVARRRAEAAVLNNLTTTIPGLRGADVTITGTPFLTQLAAKKLDRVEVTATAMVAGALELTDVQATLTDVLTEESEAGTLTATASVTAGALAGVTPGLTYTVEDGQLVASLADAPLAAVVVPSARGDAIALDVTELRLGGVAIKPEDLPLGLGDAFNDLTLPVDLPRGLRLTDVTVAAPALRVTVSGTDVPLTSQG